ncbi:MAG TPA: prepilin-type N-terminal cleavage/methylation domain-containing protein [Candidatus Paceibacterota bacterium]|nr:prepilin-type N-terminal cleavage/methylation domain-containing protein [Candidatus Paceibacterota bacterium]
MEKTSGFTLIETMVAVTILTLSVAGPLYTADRAIVAAQTASAQLTASYLAQEGVEYVRMLRDDDYLNTYYTPGATDVSITAWTAFLTEIAPCAATACMLDPLKSAGVGPTDALIQLTTGTPQTLYDATPLYLLSNGEYTQQSGSGTKQVFTRIVQAAAVSATEEAVTSTVTWPFHDTTYKVTVTDHLTQWQ